MVLYLAHPITGLSGKDVLSYYDNMETILNGYEIMSPMNGKRYLENVNECLAHGYKTAVANNHAIFERDVWMVQRSDVVLCDLSGSERISIGCCMELAIASYLRKHTVLVLPPNNVHKHSFILEAADIVFEAVEDAIRYLEGLSNADTDKR